MQNDKLKRKTLVISGIFIGVFLFCGSGFCQNKSLPIEVKAAVDNQQVNIGDKIEYEVVVRARKNIEIEIGEISFKDDFKDFSILDRGFAKKGFLLNRKYQRGYVLQPFVTGTFVIPSVAVKYRQKGIDEWKVTETENIDIEVKSLLIDGESNDIKDIKGPLSEKRKLWLILLLIGVIIAVISGFFLLRGKFRPRNKQEERFIEPAYKIALRALDKLREDNLAGRGEIEKYYIKLADIIRSYVEDRFNIRAPEMTTEEFLYNLKARKELNFDQKSALREFLTCADMVKFAKYQPLSESIDNSFNTAYKFVEETADIEENPKFEARNTKQNDINSNFGFRIFLILFRI